MFVRRKKNKSGSISIMVQDANRVSGKKFPVTETIRYFGSSHDPKIIDKLYKEATDYKNKLKASFSKDKIMKITHGDDIKSCYSINSGFYDVYGSCFDNVFKDFNIKPNLLSKLKDLSIIRIADPKSKLKTIEIANEYGSHLSNLTVDSIYKFMDKMKSEIDNVKAVIYNHTKQLLNDSKVNILFYDLTTLSFETNTKDEIRNFGFSKDGKHRHVQIVLALIVTQEGLPIDYFEFPGNTYEGHTLIPAIEQMQKRYNIDKAILVVDAALMNKINLKELDDRNIQYVISSRIKNVNKSMKQEIFNINNYETITDDIKTKTINNTIVYYSAKRAYKDEHDRKKDLERIEQHIKSTGKSNLTKQLQKSYIKIKDYKAEIDYKKLEEQKQYDGFFGISTNIKNPDPIELLSLCRGLWQIEQTFRIAKTNLKIRPIFHYNTQRIKVHLMICYISLSLIRYTEFILKHNNNYITNDNLHLLLKQLRKSVLIDYKDNKFEILEMHSPDLIPIYKILKIQFPRKFTCKQNYS